MRTELALAVLGFVSVITLSSILSNYGQHDPKKVLLDTVSGTVSRGNFSYWKLSQQGSLLLELTTLSGDADIYVSEQERPSYEVDRNNFSSVTCGVDTIRVPVAFPRPIGIGVFGHWSHDTSEYLMNVYLETEDQDVYSLPTHAAPVKERDRTRPTHIKRPATESPILLGILSVLDVLVEMFIV